MAGAVAREATDDLDPPTGFTDGPFDRKFECRMRQQCWEAQEHDQVLEAVLQAGDGNAAVFGRRGRGGKLWGCIPTASKLPRPPTARTWSASLSLKTFAPGEKLARARGAPATPAAGTARLLVDTRTAVSTSAAMSAYLFCGHFAGASPSVGPHQARPALVRAPAGDRARTRVHQRPAATAKGDKMRVWAVKVPELGHVLLTYEAYEQLLGTQHVLDRLAESAGIEDVEILFRISEDALQPPSFD